MISSIVVALELLFGASKVGTVSGSPTKGGRGRRRTKWIGSTWDLSWDKFIEDLEQAENLDTKAAIVSAKHHEVLGGTPTNDTLEALEALLRLIPQLQPVWVPDEVAPLNLVSEVDERLEQIHRETDTIRQETTDYLKGRLTTLLQMKQEAEEAKQDRKNTIKALRLLAEKLEQRELYEH